MFWNLPSGNNGKKTSMKYIKKLAVLTAVSLFAMFAIQPVSADQPTDTFDITMTGEFLWIDITNATWAIGTVALGSHTYTNETGKTFIADIDNCTVNIDLSLQITSDGATWNDGATPGADTYRLNASINTWVAECLLSETSDTVISSDYAFGTNETFDLRLDAPTSGTSGAQQTITVTATITKH